MTRPRMRSLAPLAQIAIFAALALLSSLLPGCGGGSASTTTPPGTPPGTPPAPASNVQAISVNPGPATAVGAGVTDIAFTSVTVCVPGSTSQCQTIDGIMVDTGSSGLRILSSALTLSLPQQVDNSSNPIAECTVFADGETWGPVQSADISISGEKAGSVPIQVIGSSSANFANVPTSCSSQGPIEDDLASLGTNGILGVGLFAQDCGSGCAVSGAQNAGFYFSCPTTGCQVTAEPLTSQVSNPVASFATDNNGVIIELPALSSPQASLSRSLIFGIGTQSNNGLGSATIYTADPNIGNFTTTFKGQTLTDAAFLDSGSNGIYFLDAATTGMPVCTDLTFLYCPASTQSLSATNQGLNGATGTVNFSIGNGDTLTSNGNDVAIPDLGGPNPGTFDWGLPFFFGRNVFVAIEGKNTPSGQPPFWAY
jgi:hypothetical protein